MLSSCNEFATDMATTTSNTNPGLSFNSSLPAEIREQIYLMSILAQPCSPEGLPAFTQEPPLTHVCRLWRIESLPLYYKYHRYSISTPLRLSAYREMYNPLVDSKQPLMLPPAEALGEMQKLRVLFRGNWFSSGGDVVFKINIERPDRRGRYGRSLESRSGNSMESTARFGWIVRCAGVDAYNSYDPREWWELAGELVRYVEIALEEGFSMRDLCEDKCWDQGREAERNTMTRDVLKRVLCIDLREIGLGGGHPMWVH